jgi:hypothetical protein
MHTYPLEQFAVALEAIEAGRVHGKVVLSSGAPDDAAQQAPAN